MEICLYMCKSIVIDKIHTFLKKQTNKQKHNKTEINVEGKGGKGLEHNTG